MDYKIYNCNATDLEAHIERGSVDLIVTSPPYDTLRSYGGIGDGWNELTFKEIACNLSLVLKEGGVLVWVVNDKTEGGSETGSAFKQALYFIQLGLKLNDTMIWRKTNPMPQVKQPRYSQDFEYMFVFSKGKPKTFNPIMVPCKCAGQNYDSTCKNMGGENGRTEKHFTINKEKVDSNVWDIAIAQNKTDHPAVFPIEIPLRHIKTWSNEGDVVLDPFMGSGTTGLAALELGRKFIGVDLNKDYCRMAEKRIKEYEEKTLHADKGANIC